MTTWILIYWISRPMGIATTTVEFNSLSSCEKAAEVLKKQDDIGFAYCVENKDAV